MNYQSELNKLSAAKISFEIKRLYKCIHYSHIKFQPAKL